MRGMPHVRIRGGRARPPEGICRLLSNTREPGDSSLSGPRPPVVVRRGRGPHHGPDHAAWGHRAGAADPEPHIASLSDGGSWGQQHDSQPRRRGTLGRFGPPDARHWTVILQNRQALSMHLARVSSLAMGALAVEELDVGISEAFPRVPGVDGVLGADVLDYFRLTVDRASRQLTLEVIHSAAPPKEYPVQDIVDVS
jgi:hypothetical protein